MRHRHDSPRDRVRQPAWADWLADRLGLTDYSATAPRSLLARCLLLAAATGFTLSHAAQRLARRGRETIRKGVAAALPDDPRVLEDRLAAGLRHTLPRRYRGRPLPVAIDLHRRPYYGDRRRTPAVTGGPFAAGTSWYWSYATAVSVKPGRRYTLGVTAVGPGDAMPDVVDRLLAQVGRTGLPVRYVLLDRAFYAVGVVAALARRGLRFVVPVVRRGRDGAKFFRRGTRGWFTHTFGSRNHAASATVRVAVVPGPDGNRPLVFACSAGFRSGPAVALAYRRRFGIETSYRQLGECLAGTTSRDVVYRLLLVGVSLLIRAWWVVAGPDRLSDLCLDVVEMFAVPGGASSTDPNTTQTTTPPPHPVT
jgi:putative transposase